MGACSITNSCVGYSVREAFDALVREATDMYGHDSYNGTISTCCLGRVTKTFTEYKKENMDEAYEHIHSRIDSVSKGVVNVVDLGLVSWDVITAKVKQADKVVPKFKMMYNVIGFDDRCGERVICVKETKKEAEEFGRKYVLGLASGRDKGIVGAELDIVKRPTLISGKELQSEISCDIKCCKKRPNVASNDPKRIVREKHKYLFYGWAVE